jgi:histidyl-tRNA synthetase
MYKRLRGTHDIYGDNALYFQKIESAARKVFHNFGFSELRTPILEEKELFCRALGTDTDVVQKEMYEFEDRSKTQVAMRPEGTAGVVRAYIENEIDKTEGLAKFYYLGAMFRSERPQAGRLRQFHQIGVEQIGTDSPLADAETILCLAGVLDSLGITDYKIKLNMLGTLEERQVFKNALLEYFTPLAQSLCEDCRNRMEKNVYRIFDCKKEPCKAIVAKAPFIHPGAPLLPRELSEASHAHFDIVRSALDKAGAHYVIDPAMVRGLDYYTKTVFEITHPKLGAQDALAAGGRYDKLVESFGGPPAGAVGFAIGIERLVMCLAQDKKPETSFENVFFVATLGDEARTQGFVLLCALRKAGVAALMDFSAKSLKSQMRSANKARCRYVIILGDNELKEKKFVLKDMQTGEQREHLLEHIQNVTVTLLNSPLPPL